MQKPLSIYSKIATFSMLLGFFLSVTIGILLGKGHALIEAVKSNFQTSQLYVIPQVIFWMTALIIVTLTIIYKKQIIEYKSSGKLNSKFLAFSLMVLTFTFFTSIGFMLGILGTAPRM